MTLDAAEGLVETLSCVMGDATLVKLILNVLDYSWDKASDCKQLRDVLVQLMIFHGPNIELLERVVRLFEYTMQRQDGRNAERDYLMSVVTDYVCREPEVVLACLRMLINKVDNADSVSELLHDILPRFVEFHVRSKSMVGECLSLIM